MEYCGVLYTIWKFEFSKMAAKMTAEILTDNYVNYVTKSSAKVTVTLYYYSILLWGNHVKPHGVYFCAMCNAVDWNIVTRLYIALVAAARLIAVGVAMHSDV